MLVQVAYQATTDCIMSGGGLKSFRRDLSKPSHHPESEIKQLKNSFFSPHPRVNSLPYFPDGEFHFMAQTRK